MKKNKKTCIRDFLILFLIIFVIMLVLHKYFNIGSKQYRYDVYAYNEIGKSLFKGGHFDLLNFSDDFRGFAFPTFMGFCNFLDVKLGVVNSIHFVSSFILSLLFTIYLYFCKKLFYKQNKDEKKIFKSIRYIIPLLLVIIFFYGLIIYPLTDLYASLLCIDSAFIIWCAFDDKKVKKIVKYFFAGFLLYITYNIRTIYQLSLITFLIFIIYNELKTKKIVITIISTIAYTSGALIAAIPQFIMNFVKYHSISPWINNLNLFGQQLFWGLEYNKYATYIGSTKNLKAGGMYFSNAVGMHAAQAWQNSGMEISVLSYIKLFFHYPIEYISMFTKHIFNAFFILFPEQYVQNINKNLIPLAVLSLLVIFVFAVFLFIRSKSEKINYKKTIFAIAITVPSLAILLGAVEERFLVLPYLLIYGFIAFFDFRKLKKFFNKKTVVITSLLLIVFMAISFTIESDILDDLTVGEEKYPLYFCNK